MVTAGKPVRKPSPTKRGAEHTTVRVPGVMGEFSKTITNCWHTILIDVRTFPKPKIDTLSDKSEKNEKVPILSIPEHFNLNFKHFCTDWRFYEQESNYSFCPRTLGRRFFVEQIDQSACGQGVRSNFGPESDHFPCRRRHRNQKSDRPCRRRCY